MTAGGVAERYSRQIAAFGPGIQPMLARTTIAIGGVGGVGSFVAQALAHLGAATLLLIDDDIVEASNLNRLIGATPADARTAAKKVEVVARAVRQANPDTTVLARPGNVLEPSVWAELRAADVIIGAVDKHAPRWAMNRLAVQYARCYLDIGVELRASATGEMEAGGHVAVVRPNGPCLLCLSGYDPRQVARELDPDLATARRASGYLADAPNEPTPSVVFLNQVVAGHAVAELVNWLSPWRTPAPYLLIDLVGSTTTVLHAERHEHCPACGPGSPRALGDAGGTLE